jgi:hypothetical protein
LPKTGAHLPTLVLSGPATPTRAIELLDSLPPLRHRLWILAEVHLKILQVSYKLIEAGLQIKRAISWDYYPSEPLDNSHHPMVEHFNCHFGYL